MKSFVLCALFFATAWGYVYTPGKDEKKYPKQANVTIMVTSLRSDRDLTPFDFYHLPFCKPKNPQSIPDDPSMGQDLMGSAMQQSPYTVSMMVNQSCAVLDMASCEKDTGTAAAFKAKLTEVRRMIEDEYRGHISVDNLPGWNKDSYIMNQTCTNFKPSDESQGFGRRGYFIGVRSSCTGECLLNNHLHFDFKVHESLEGYSVVGFNVWPMSIAWSGSPCVDGEPRRFVAEYPKPLRLADIGQQEISWTYSVRWSIRETTWSNRWDAFLDKSSDGNLDYSSHIWYIMVSTILAGVLASLGYLILIRMLRRDIDRYNRQQATGVAVEDQQEDVGWKLVHGDVFRPPERCGLLSALVGSGSQLFMMSVCTLGFSWLGILSPASRGVLLSTIILLFVLGGFLGGYVTGRLLKTFHIREWKYIFLCALLFPGCVFGVWFVANLVFWHLGSSAAVPFARFLALVGLWLLMTTSLTVVGGSFAFHQDPISFPVPVGKLAREIPEVHLWYLKPPATLLLPGLVPFIIANQELNYVMRSIWLGQIYYSFFFLSITFAVWLLVVVLVTLITQYYQLTYEDYRWWWRSFAIPSGCGVPVLAMAAYFYLFSLNLNTAIALYVYWGYMLLFTAAYVLVSGFVGLGAGLLLSRIIYGAIKVD